MSARFSGVLQLTDLDDFITPSQECIKPVEIKKNQSSTGSKITIQEDGAYVQLLENNGSTNYQKLEKVAITLSDCLACSGCITSAESVLITQQSQEELLRVFHENKQLKETTQTDRNNQSLSKCKLIIVSVSIQPILSLAIYYNLTPNECAAKVAGYFKYLGADMVVDMTLADDLALIECEREFVQRFRAQTDADSRNVLPMLSSSCPGWVCYAEKTHGSYILPYISTTKSPQQIMGSLIKSWKERNNDGRDIYHVTLMPCYDKKLEAARDDFFDKTTLTKDVDCVITAIELQQMLEQDGRSLIDCVASTFAQPWSNGRQHNLAIDSIETDVEEVPPYLTSHIGSGSGGYSDYIFKNAAKELFGLELDDLQYKTLRNPDFREIILEQNNKVLMRFAIANGFRNIQNLVQKLKRGRSQYHYVEVMACPSGCLNGGAQVRPRDGVSLKDLTVQLENMYRALPAKSADECDLIRREVYDMWLGGRESDKCMAILHTQYHAVEKATNALNIKW